MKIEVKNVSKKFNDNLVIDNISLEFESGKCYGIYGRNGSGKSVFLKLIAGLYIPTSGSIIVDNHDITKENIYPKDVRALIEHPSFFPDISGYENLKLLAEIQNKIGADEIIKALEVVNLKDDKDKKFSKYSLGMKQKLGVSQVIMEDSEIMLFDEPFNGIERETVAKISEYINMKKREGKIIIISSHIIGDLDKISDIIYEFDNGKIVGVRDE